MRLIWRQSALNALATLWVNADSATRQAITKASNTLEQELRRDPFANSESRTGMNRFIFMRPLCVTFRVDVASNTVIILHVRLYRPRKK